MMNPGISNAIADRTAAAVVSIGRPPLADVWAGLGGARIRRSVPRHAGPPAGETHIGDCMDTTDEHVSAALVWTDRVVTVDVRGRAVGAVVPWACPFVSTV